jgi:hypothetical protein
MYKAVISGIIIEQLVINHNAHDSYYNRKQALQ